MILHDIETESRLKIEDLQLARLKATLKKVEEHVPFYHKKFSDLHLTANDLQSLDDITKYPFTTKKDLRDHYPFGLFAVARGDLVRVHASSGTSGKPTVVGYTQNDINMWREIVARAITIGGGQPGEALHNAYGYGLFTGGLGLHYGSEKLGMLTVPVSGGNTQRQNMLIEDFEPTVICCTPSYLLNIAETMQEMGKDTRGTSLKYAILGAEPWSEEMRGKIEETFGLKACDIYGLSEVIGPGVAMECHQAQNGLHIAEDHFYVEVIDPNTLKPLPDGEEGELVFTSLTKEAMPIIRYRTGDIASITKESCSCGRTTVRMSRVKGRIDDMLNINGVNVFPSEIERCLLSVPEIAPHYQIVIVQNKAFKEIQVEVEFEEAYYREFCGDIEQLDKLKTKMKHLLKSDCLVSMDVNILGPKSIPRSEGKAVRIIDKTKETMHS